MDNPRQSIYALRGWIDRIEQDARADAAKKYGTRDDAKPATPPSDNPWGPGEVSIRLTPEHGCASGPPTRGSVVTPSPTEAPRPSAPEAARAPLRSERAPQRECERAPLRSERAPAEERRAPQREGAPQLRDSDDAVAAAHARAQRYEAERRAEPACARRPELRECAPRPDRGDEPARLRASAPAGGAPGSLDEARRLLKAWSFVEEEAQRRVDSHTASVSVELAYLIEAVATRRTSQRETRREMDVTIYDPTGKEIYNKGGQTEGQVSMSSSGSRGPWKVCFKPRSTMGLGSVVVELSYFHVDMRTMIAIQVSQDVMANLADWGRAPGCRRRRIGGAPGCRRRQQKCGKVLHVAKLLRSASSLRSRLK